MIKALSALALSLALFVSLGAAQSDERQSGFVTVPGGPVWYEVMGGGDGVPLIVLHGGPGGTSCGYQALAPLGDERAVIRYDQLGSGRSGRPTDTDLWNRDRFVEELDALRDALELDEVHILGHSWGGALAAYYYLETEGAGVRSLVLSSPLISTRLWIEDTNYLRTLLPRRVQRILTRHEEAGTTDSKAYRAAEDVFNEEFVRRGDAVESYSCPGAPWNPVIYNHMWGPTEFFATGTLQDFDLTARLAEIDVPTLFVTGEFDEARPQTIEGFADLVPGAEFRVIPGVGHASISRGPEQYRDMVRAFLDRAEAAAEPQNNQDR
ncbi:MAG: proline iminopeptidase-family hydrolase [Pseudomonadota bacterium]